VKCILAADSILGAGALRERLRALDTVSSCPSFTELWLDMGSALREASMWLLTTHGNQLSLIEMVQLYAASFETLLRNAQKVFTGQELARFDRRVEQYKNLGVSPTDAVRFSLFRRALSVLEVLWASREFQQDVNVVASVYSQVLEDLAINTLFKFEPVLEAANKWESELVSGSYQEIRRNLSLLTGKLLRKGAHTPEAVDEALRSSPGYEAIRTTMSDVEEGARLKRAFQVAVLPVLSRQLRLLSV
jgi:NAD-specific glutamate dehydrogenase